MGTLITELLRQLTKKKQTYFGSNTTKCVRICFGLNGYDVGAEFKSFCYRQMPAHSYCAQFNGNKLLKSGW